MKIVFVGASKFGLRCLKSMIPLPGCELVGAITVPQTFPISYRPQGVTNVLHADLKSYCDLNNINCWVMTQGMNDSDILDHVQKLSPEMFIVVGWYHMLPKSWRDIAPAFGLHASILPDYSGGSPLIWALINGEAKTGITLFELTEGVDSGQIIGQKSTNIFKKDTIATLYQRIESLGIELIHEQLPPLMDGTAIRVFQDESKRRVFPQRGPEDGEINWDLSAHHLYNFIRAQTKPYPGAFSVHGKTKVTIWASRTIDKTINLALPPGEIRMIEQRIIVGCGEGLLEITDIALNGKDIPVHTWWTKQSQSSSVSGFS
jgi:methionyl-tRNA formyltransferase